MRPCNFVFDIIVTRYVVTNAKLSDPKKLTVKTSINNKAVVITSSRHNVTEFKHNSQVEFLVQPTKLRESLEKCGLPIIVTYGSLTIGEGQLKFPQMFIDQIQEGMSDLLHSDTCTIERNGETAGTVELLCRLLIKCDDPTVQEDKVCRQNVDKSINPMDIMFIMGESQHCPNPTDICPDVLAPEEGDERLQLDLQRYQSRNPTWSPERILMQNTAGNSACCQLKQMTRECERIVDSINQSTGNTNPYDCLRTGPDIRRNQAKENDTHVSADYPDFSFLPTQQKKSNNVCHPATIPVPISDINKPNIKPTRFCPVCLTNMSWLPKLAACPKCGLKPTLIFEERHKDKKLTADEILVDYLGKPSEGVDNYCKDPCEEKRKEVEKREQQTECRCTCKFGKLCAHCRIRKLCADIFQADEKTVCPTVKPVSSEDYCTIVENPEECRPYLTRVFSELRDLYNLKESKLVPSHERICGKTALSKQKSPKVIEKKAASTDVPKLKTKSSLTEKKPRLGHKHCVNEKPAVPRNHGWHWKSSRESRKHGWRPGYILKPIKRLMKFFLQYLPEDNAFNACKKEAQDEKKDQSILNVCKKNGEIFITLRAVNDRNVEMKPITFKIVKSDQAIALREIKKRLKERGFRKCTCHRTLMMCVCRNSMEKSQLRNALQCECHRRGIETCVNQLVLTDTSDSEMEFDVDVTPPAGTEKPPKLLKRRQVNNSTQTSKKDQIVPPKFPTPRISKYWRTYDCAAGDRYRGTALGAPGEAVFEDGVFGLRGGGAHGESAAPGGKLKSTQIWGAAPGQPLHGRGRKQAGPGGSGELGRLFDSANRKPRGSTTTPIPVKYPKRFLKAAEEAKRAKRMEQIKLKRSINMMKYLKEHDTRKGKDIIGPDGLTEAQRRRRALHEVSLPSIDNVVRRGRGYDPCTARCNNPCAEWCSPFGYRC